MKPKRCPMCGGVAFIAHDCVNGVDYGYTVGCQHASVYDKVHHLDAIGLDKARLVLYGFNSRKEAIEAWNKRCEE